MYKLLIVEDDDNIRKGLAKIIKKMDLQIENIYEASNGKEALTIYNKAKPQIIITDIKMPEMDGLDFIEQIRKVNKAVKFIILSGYSEFTYAQRAIRCKVIEYLQKPVEKEKLYNLLVSVILTIDKEKKEVEEKMKKDNKVKEYKKIIFRDILKGVYKQEEIKKILLNADIDYRNKLFVVLSIFIDSEQQNNIDKIKKIFNRYEMYTCYKSIYNHTNYLFGIPKASYQDIYISDILTMIENINTFYDTAVYVGISELTNNVLSLSQLLKQAEMALDYRLINTNKKIFDYIELKDIKQVKIKIKSMHFKEISNALKENNINKFNRCFDDMFNLLIESKYITPTVIKDMLKELILFCIPNNIIDIEKIYRNSKSLNTLKIKIKQYLLKEVNTNESTNLKDDKVYKAINYMEENYKKDITLDEVSIYLNINSTYFSFIFKKETGINFCDYLQRIRIEKSKQYLLNSNYKIYEIAQMVGFINDKYYFKLFKKSEGITPSQYRKKFNSSGTHLDVLNH